MKASILALGILIPYLARVPGALAGRPDWLWQYLSGGLGGFLLIEAANALVVGAAWLSLVVFRGRLLAGLPIAAGYSVLFVLHAGLDLSADAQAAIALLFIPVYSLPAFLVGAVIAAGGLALRRGRSRRPVAGSSPPVRAPGGAVIRYP